MRPLTRYAKSGDVHVAYQVIGSGPRDLVLSPGFISNLDLHWEEAGYSRLLRTLGSFARVIHFDKRGTGLSDRVGGIPTLEERMDDVRAVMDAAGSRSAAIFGASEGGAMAMLFAATYPQRTEALILYGSYAHFLTWVLTPDQLAGFIANAEATWGTGSSLKSFAPSLLNDPVFADWWARYERQGASPSAAIALARMNAEIDVRHILPLIRVPTLVLHRVGDPRVRVDAGRFLAQSIQGARYRELPGNVHPIWTGSTEDITDAVAEFLTGRPAEIHHDSVLATVLALGFEDTKSPGREFDLAASRRGLQVRDAVASMIGRFHGHRLGNAWLAAFDGPARAVRCAKAIRARLSELGIAVRAGLHAGELPVGPNGPAGLAALTASRIAGHAAPGDILVSGTVRDLVAGSGLMLRLRGTVTVGGVVGSLPLFVVDDTPAPNEPEVLAPRSMPASAPSSRLTAREVDVVRLLARGLTNSEIGASLGLSEHTVKRHVANVLVKLDLPSRAAVAAFVAREGLVTDG